MAGLVREREHAVEHFGLVVHQDVGRPLEPAAGECAGALAFVLVAIDPARADESFAERVGVGVAERANGVAHHRGGLVVGEVRLGEIDERAIRVVVVDFLEFEDALA